MPTWPTYVCTYYTYAGRLCTGTRPTRRGDRPVFCPLVSGPVLGLVAIVNLSRSCGPPRRGRLRAYTASNSTSNSGPARVPTYLRQPFLPFLSLSSIAGAPARTLEAPSGLARSLARSPLPSPACYTPPCNVAVRDAEKRIVLLKKR